MKAPIKHLVEMQSHCGQKQQYGDFFDDMFFIAQIKIYSELNPAAERSGWDVTDSSLIFGIQH